MTTIDHKEFLITKYVKFLQRYGVPPLISSLIFGATFVIPAIILTYFQKIPFMLGYFSCLFWLFVGPFLIYEAGKIVDELWPKLVNVLEKNEIEELKSYERRFHSNKYLFVAIPGALVVSGLILIPLGFPWSMISIYSFFYLVSWITLAFLGSIGVWGTFQLISLIWKLRKYDFNLNPYCSDGFGGMGHIADFGIKATMMYSTGALMIPMAYDLGIRDLTNQTFFTGLFASSFFAFTVLLSFIIQLVALNRAAVKGKNNLLEKTGNECRFLIKDCGENQDLNTGIQTIISHNLYNQIFRMNVYPFNVSVLVKLVGSITLPIVLGTIRIWIPWIPLFG